MDQLLLLVSIDPMYGIPLITRPLKGIIGLGRALEMILTRKPISAYEALASGLVNEVVAPGQSLQRAMEIAQAIARFPQVSMRNDRYCVYAGLGKDLSDGLRIEARFGLDTMQSGEPQAGSQEFQKGKGRKGDFRS